MAAAMRGNQHNGRSFAAVAWVMSHLNVLGGCCATADPPLREQRHRRMFQWGVLWARQARGVPPTCFKGRAG